MTDEEKFQRDVKTALTNINNQKIINPLSIAQGEAFIAFVKYFFDETMYDVGVVSQFMLNAIYHYASEVSAIDQKVMPISPNVCSGATWQAIAIRIKQEIERYIRQLH